MRNRERSSFLLPSVVLLVLLGVLILGRCTFEKPSAPTWDVEYIIPLAGDTYTMAEIADETDDLDTLDQEVIFTVEQEIDPFEVGEYLRTKGAQSSTSIYVPWSQTEGWEGSVDSEILMPDSIVVQSATLKGGEVDIAVDNPTGYRIRVEVEIPSLTRGGVILPLEVEVDAGESSFLSVPLEDCVFAPDTSGGRNVVDYTLRVEILEVVQNQGGTVNLTVHIADILFR